MLIADLHIHSRFSRATSKDGDLPHLDLWARRKGIHLVGTGDLTHPAWRAELAEQLLPAEEGLYVLRPRLRIPDEIAGPEIIPRFVLTAEISSIYKKNGKTRKVHNVILLPSLEAAETLSRRLEVIGNIHSDGRPILGLDSRDLLEITLDACPSAVFIPAHIWTPHFSMFGAFSGFDTVEECFEDLTPYIHAVETGLSSDPPMNWRVSALDRFTLVSNSDAHSPAKLGREANLLDIGLSYPALSRALQTGEGFHGTLEFFPEEGKYHLDGHRACGVCLTPAQTIAAGGICPVCGKKLTIGVEHRVEELADRPMGARPANAKPFESLAPLAEVVAASTGLSAGGRKNAALCAKLLRTLGPEFPILRDIPIEQLETQAGPCVAEGVRRLRAGQVQRTAGFDGEYGVISLLSPEERETLNGQVSLFGVPTAPHTAAPARTRPARRPLQAATLPTADEPPPAADDLNPEQREAVLAAGTAVAVVAGPGTGKTKTLVSRIVHLVEDCAALPERIAAVTFTNQAAAEMRQRLQQRLGNAHMVQAISIGTFHSLCLKLLGDVVLLSEGEALDLAAATLRDLGRKGRPQALLQMVSRKKNGVPIPETQWDEEAFVSYCQRLEEAGAADFDDLLLRALQLPEESRRFDHLLVDEFQDVNDLQYRLTLRWIQDADGLFVIGDPDQSIYGFRGADSRCFDRLAEDLPALRTIRLVQNYRSVPQVLKAALAVINGDGGTPHQLTATRPVGLPVRWVSADNDFQAGVYLAKEIGRMVGGIGMLEAKNDRGRADLRSFSDVAVLCRTHRQAELLEHCLRHDGIPCVVAGREDFLLEEEVRGAVGFFRWMLDPADLLSLRSCLTLNWRLPTETVEEALILCDGMGPSDLAQLRDKAVPDPLAPWLDRVERFLPLLGAETPLKLLERWMEEQGASPALARLADMAVFHETLPDFLLALALGEEGDLRRVSGKQYASGAVRLMTLHGSKGLEFPVVFLAGVQKGRIPLESPRRPTDWEEERRLLYVGMTRAKEELVLLSAEEPSPFLTDLPDGLFQREYTSAPAPEAEQLTLF